MTTGRINQVNTIPLSRCVTPPVGRHHPLSGGNQEPNRALIVKRRSTSNLFFELTLKRWSAFRGSGAQQPQKRLDERPGQACVETCKGITTQISNQLQYAHIPQLLTNLAKYRKMSKLAPEVTNTRRVLITQGANLLSTNSSHNHALQRKASTAGQCYSPPSGFLHLAAWRVRSLSSWGAQYLNDPSRRSAASEVQPALTPDCFLNTFRSLGPWGAQCLIAPSRRSAASEVNRLSPPGGFVH